MKKIIIIGASSGIGKNLAKVYAKRGNLVGATARRKHELTVLKEEFPAQIKTKSFDIIDDNSIDRLNELIEDLGGLDILIFSAGIGELNEQLDNQIEQQTIDLNVSAFTKTLNWIYSYFQQNNGGQIVAISSIGGLRGSGIAPAYNATKAYQINYLEGLQQKSKKGKHNIVITDIRPGLVDTKMAKGEGLFWVMPTKKVALQIVNKIERKKSVGYVTKRWKLIALLLKLLPKWLYTKM